MIEVTMKFNSMAEAAKFFVGHAVEISTSSREPVFGRDLPVDAKLATETKTYADGVTATGPSPLPDASPAEKPATTRTRKPKNVPADAATPPAAPEPETESGGEQAKITIDDLRTALDGYIKANGEGGFAKGTWLIKSFQKADGTPAGRVSEVQECDYAKFIAAAKVVS